MATPVIEIQSADVSSSELSSTPVLQGVSWTVNSGEVWIVFGPAGSGKSDLLLTAAGLLRPSAGSCRLFGHHLANLSEEDAVSLRLRIGFVFGGDGRLFDPMTVGENVAFPLRYHRNCRAAEVGEQVAAVLEETGLSAHAAKLPRTLNRQLKLQTALARALVLDPEVIILDEPLSGAGPRERAWWTEMLGRICNGSAARSGGPATVVIGTNDIRTCIGQGSRFGLLRDRQFWAIGDRAELERHPDPFVQEHFSHGN